MHTKFKTFADSFRGQGKDEAIEKVLEREAKAGFVLVSFSAEHNPYEYRFIFAKTEAEKTSKS